MNRFSFIVLFAASLTLAGCSSTNPTDPGVPKEAALLSPGDRTGMAQAAGSMEAEVWQPDSGGALYVYDAGGTKVGYSGPVEAGDAILIYPTGVAVAGRRKSLSGKVMIEKRVSNFEPGHTYRVYFQAGGTPVAPTPDPNNTPTTRAFQVRDRVIDPAGIIRKDK